MQTVVADFARLNERVNIDPHKRSIPLGTAKSRSELADLQDKQQVILIKRGNLKAEGHIVLYQQNDVPYYYGVVDGPIEDIPE